MEMVAFARRLVQTPSLSGEEGDVAQLVAAEMQSLGYDEVRVDEAGNVQPTREALIKLRGISSVGYHVNPITGWRIRSDGSVIYHAEAWS